MAHGGGSTGFADQPWYKKIFLAWTHSAAEHISEKWLYAWAFEPLMVVPIAFLILLIVAANIDRAAVEGTAAMVISLMPIWLPIYLFVFFWVTWMHYIRYAFWFMQKHVLLEIQLPPEVEKSPLAMELFLTGIWNAGGEGTFLARVWEGKFRAQFTLELVSNEGQVKFYIHCRQGWKNVVEAKLYGQYPEAKVTQVEDYVAKVPFNNSEYSLWGTEFKKMEAAQALPIKTYIDYTLDKSPDKPETQVDPITNIVEYMGQIGQGEYIWLQIVMQAPKGDSWWYGFPISGNPWKDLARKKINDITKQAIKRAQDLIEGDDPDVKKEKQKVGSRGSTLLSGGEKLQVEAIEHSLTKTYFECGIRGLYLGKNENFNGANIGNLVMLFAAYRQAGYNQIMPERGTNWFDYPWQDIWDVRQNKMKQSLFFRFKHRAYFFVPYDQVPVYMTTEELATIWHFPSSVVQTPALDRVPSRRSEAPLNLPT